MRRSIRSSCANELRSQCRQFKESGKLACLLELSSVQVSASCKDELREYQEQAARFGQLDVQLQSHCRKEISACSQQLSAAHKGPGDISSSKVASASSDNIMQCLLSKRKDMSPRSGCRDYLFQRQVNAGENIKLDAALHDACEDDLQEFCGSADDVANPGISHDCLRDHIDDLSDECRLFELERMKLESTDIRLNARLNAKCGTIVEQSCQSLSPKDRVHCLEQLREDPEFPRDCLEALTKVEIRSAADNQLELFLHEECAADVKKLCKKEENVDEAKEQFGQRSNEVLSCLVRKVAAINDVACKSRVQQQMAERAADIRMDPAAIEACLEDMKALCPGIDPSHGHMHMCLRQQFESLSESCKNSEFQEVRIEMRAEFMVNPTIKVGSPCL